MWTNSKSLGRKVSGDRREDELGKDRGMFSLSSGGRRPRCALLAFIVCANADYCEAGTIFSEGGIVSALILP